MNVPAPMIGKLVRLRWFWLPALLLVALWLPGVNAGWYRTDTHYYAAVGKQAVDAAIQRGSAMPLLELMAGDRAYFNKPPLVFVIEGLTIRWLGLDIWTVRLPSLVAAIVLCVSAAGVARRLSGPRVAVLAGLVAATTIEVFRYTRAVSLDLWQAALIMLAVWCVVAGVGRLREGGRDRAWLLVLSGVPLGLALLCKPLVALVTLPVLGVWLVTAGRGRLAVWLGLAGLVAVAIASPWHVFMALRHPEFVEIYFGRQSLERITRGSDDTGSEPWWYYLRIIGEGYWPWLVTLALGVLAWHRCGPGERDRRLLLLCAIWCGVWLLLLSLSAGKSSRYLLLVWPIAGFISAWWIARRKSAPGSRRASTRAMLWLGPAAMVAGVAAAILIPGRLIHHPRAKEWDRVLEEVSRRPGVPLYATPRAHPHAPQMVMLGREWPATWTGQTGERLMLDVASDVGRSAAETPRGELLVQGKDIRLFRLAE